MLNVRQILVSAAALVLTGVALTACGQRGPLYLPTTPAAKNRATLPELLKPGSGDAGETKPESADTPAPVKAPAGAASAPATSEGTK
ncbi:LPS translocon maturation chaperone LptM [Variovorax sp. PBL-E5]|uniref:LPS translocon maturation chaperone LptM n=1 Tax=Variovorax sp. PBL-E5 TaxID=434014 RepID=UPI001315F358|nr:lipoprotein [Variovorax sp. PBL-E5]VTU20992.1 putative small periplasmic lipoprotein [Variovorax sp. PBL-E5]